MPLLFERHEPNYSIAAWRVEESLEELSRAAGIPQATMPVKAISRQKESLAIQLLLRHLFPGKKPVLVYDENGKPHLENNPRSVSISHTGLAVGVLISSRPSCGLDMEHIHPRIEKIAGRFLSDNEGHVLEHKNLEALYVAWGAKEVLYKIHGKGNLVFSEHLHVKPFELAQSGSVIASLQAGNVTRFFPVEYFFFNDLVISFALA